MKVQFVAEFVWHNGTVITLWCYRASSLCGTMARLWHFGVTGHPDFTADLRGSDCMSICPSVYTSKSHDLHSGRKAGIAQSV